MELLDYTRQTVEDLSDLRYGKLSNSQLKGDVVEGLASLQDACERKT
jgi:centromere-localized protein 2